jgi:hypothetical protein
MKVYTYLLKYADMLLEGLEKGLLVYGRQTDSSVQLALEVGEMPASGLLVSLGDRHTLYLFVAVESGDDYVVLTLGRYNCTDAPSKEIEPLLRHLLATKAVAIDVESGWDDLIADDAYWLNGELAN